MSSTTENNTLGHHLKHEQYKIQQKKSLKDISGVFPMLQESGPYRPELSEDSRRQGLSEYLEHSYMESLAPYKLDRKR